MARIRDIMDQRKQMILNFIHLYRATHQGVSPTDREISIGIGYAEKSYGSVNVLTSELIKEGWLKRATKGSRGLVPVHPASEKYYDIKRADLVSLSSRQESIARSML